jgi:hypothetical protein
VRDPVSVSLDGLREAGQWIQAAVSGSSAPGVEEARHLGGGQPPEVLEGLLHLGRLHTCRRDPHHPKRPGRATRLTGPISWDDLTSLPGGGGRGLGSA